MTATGMREYFEQQYSPGNIALVACGDVDFAQLVERAEKNCGDWKPFDVDRTSPDFQPVLGRKDFTKESASQQYTVQISSGPSGSDPLRFAAQLLSYAVGDDSGSRFYWDLVDPGLVEYTELYPRSFDDTGILMTFVCCAPEENEANLERIAKIQQDVDRNGITQEELDLVKIKVCSQLVRRSERPSGRLSSVGVNWLQRNEYRTVKDTIDAYQAVTLEDVRKCLEQHPLSNTMTVSIGPG
jgi:predicted Zn-dependent peptidase